MRLLTSTDLALRVLMWLAREPPGRPISVDRLASALGGLSRNHLHKIVQELTALGITRTLRGVSGGVMLAVAPDQIRLGSVIRRLETGQATVECFRPDGGACTLAPWCGLRGILGAAQARFYDSLDEHTLADCLPREAVTGAG
jgi:Rrf2 family nitric oxide-sensitive transcriptional repressor